MNRFVLSVRFGIALTSSLIAYFLVLSLFNLHINPLFSIFNGVITGFAIFESIRYKRIEKKSEYNYTTGFQAGIVTGFLATIIFTLFMAVYATEIDPDFISKIAENFFNSYNTGVGVFAFTVLLSGLATTIVLTLSFMQLFKHKLKD
jgi:glycerol uptake facilitator-like aquaporin